MFGRIERLEKRFPPLYNSIKTWQGNTHLPINHRTYSKEIIMKEISELNLPEELKYSKDHEWAKVDGDIVTVGIDDYAQDQLGEVVFVEVPEVGDTFSKGDEFGTVESVKAVSEIYLPVSGEIVEVNEGLEDAPELVNNSPYEEGWIVKVKAEDLSELDTMLDKAAYLETLKG